MSDIHSTVTELPRSCRSAADRMARALAKEDASSETHYADLSPASQEKITALEKDLSRESGTDIALVAYKLS